MHQFTLRVRYGDTDKMGFAYYANYLRWFEVGRAELMRELGHSYREVEEGGIYLPVVEAHCRYHRPARYDDELAIQTGVAHLGRATVRFGYRVVRTSDGALIAEGGTEHCFLDESGRPVRIPERLSQVLAQAPLSGARDASAKAGPG